MVSERPVLASRFIASVARLRWFTDRQSLVQLVRYGLLGVSMNIGGFMLYLGITHFGVGSKLAMSLLYALGVCISFVGNKKWVFSHEGFVLDAGLRYVSAHLVGYILNYSLLFVFVDRLGYPHAYVQAISIVAVASWLFMAFRLFVFTAANGPTAEKK